MGHDDDLGEYEVEDDRDPRQCAECGHWTDEGLFSELDDEFVCDECAMGYTHAYEGGGVRDCE
jgi:hypothetical protein